MNLKEDFSKRCNRAKEEFKSIRFRLFTILCILTIFVIFTLLVINNVVSEGAYIYSKTETIKTISQKINTYYNGTMQYDLSPELRDLEIKNNIEILIEDKNDNIIYNANKDLITAVNKANKSTKAKMIFMESNTTVEEYQESNTNKFIMLKSNLDNGYTLYIKIATAPIKENIKISNETLALIGILMVMISATLSSFVSRKFTEPILELNGITKKMANLDFSKRYRITDTDDEINTLGKNINQMSDKLESTIGQLRKNNTALERDIEEKSKIDEMRKQFISDVSHELKTPIALIQGYSEGLIENVNDDEESRKFYAEVIRDEAYKMDTMVKKLLELMKYEYRERQLDNREFDLREMIKEELRRQTVILKEKSIKIDFDDKEAIKVFADQECIEQVINNYLTNAIKHCEEKQGEKKIIIRTEKVSEKIRVFVYNTGDKISKDCIEKIWTRFYKIDTSRSREDGGTGIGLALVKAIMNNYGNEYGVKNFENGVEFYFDINTK